MNEAALLNACRTGNLDEVKKIYEAEPSIINRADARGYTPLILAVYSNQPSIVSFLLEKGAQINAQDSAGNSALMGASFKGYTEIAIQLLNAGANVNLRNGSGAPALTFAVTFGHLRIAELLLQKGANVSLADALGKTPSDHARIQGNDAMINLLERYS